MVASPRSRADAVAAGDKAPGAAGRARAGRAGAVAAGLAAQQACVGAAGWRHPRARGAAQVPAGVHVARGLVAVGKRVTVLGTKCCYFWPRIFLRPAYVIPWMSRDVKSAAPSKPLGPVLSSGVPRSTPSSKPRTGVSKDDKDYVVVSSPSSSGSAAALSTDTKLVSSAARPKPIRGPALSLAFFKLLGESVLSSSLDEPTKRFVLADLVNSASRALAGALPAEPNCGRLVRRSTGAGGLGSYEHGYEYNTQVGLNANYVGNSNLYSGAATLASYDLCSLIVGDGWGELDPAAVMVRYKSWKIRMALYPDNSRINNDSATLPSLVAPLTALSYRILVFKDRFGRFGSGTGLIPANACEVGVATITSPSDFDGFFFAPNATDPSTTLHSNQVLTLQPSKLTHPARFEILYDETIRDVAMPFYAPATSANGIMWRGHRYHEFEVKADVGIPYTPNLAPGTLVRSLFNGCTMVILSNITNALWSSSVLVPSALVDFSIISEFDTLYPDVN